MPGKVDKSDARNPAYLFDPSVKSSNKSSRSVRLERAADNTITVKIDNAFTKHLIEFINKFVDTHITYATATEAKEILKELATSSASIDPEIKDKIAQASARTIIKSGKASEMRLEIESAELTTQKTKLLAKLQKDPLIEQLLLHFPSTNIDDQLSYLEDCGVHLKTKEVEFTKLVPVLTEIIQKSRHGKDLGNILDQVNNKVYDYALQQSLAQSGIGDEDLVKMRAKQLFSPTSYSKQAIDVEPVITSEEVPVFEKVVDKVEHDWRANEKYRYITGQMVQGLKAELEDNTPLALLEKELLTLDKETIPPTSEGECMLYTAKALAALHHPRDKHRFSNERDAYKEYKHSLRKALEGDYYQKNPSSDLAKLLNMIAYMEFSKVNVQAFTESVAQKLAEKGGFDASSQPTGDLNGIKQVLQDLMPFHHSIENNREAYTALRGQILYLGLDSTIQGNPANVKFEVENREGKKITNVRTPTPTGKDGQVTPEFKAFLRHVKARGETYTMVNLQNRTDPGIPSKLVGKHGEYVRSGNLEALATDPEFAGMFTCFTLDKNSAFYHGGKEGDMEAKAFRKEFMFKLTDPESGFSLPLEWQQDKDKLKEIDTILKMVHKTVFDGSQTLSKQERQDFIEIAYIFLIDHFVKATDATYYNASCMDCIDRGGGVNWLTMAFLTLLEIHDVSRSHEASPPLAERVAGLPAKLEEDAIWAKKRPILDERIERALSAMERLVQVLEISDIAAETWIKQLNFTKIIQEPNREQATKDPSL